MNKLPALCFALAFALPVLAEPSKAEMIVANPDSLHWKAKEALPKGAFGAVVHGDPAKGDYDFIARFPAHYTVPEHFHTNEMFVTMLKGSMTLARAGQPAVTVLEGGFFSLPAGMRYVARCEKECTFQVHGAQPFDLLYVDEKDDPRKHR